jgi:uncharacterized protein YjiS (DUF1127 family)
MVLVRKKRGSLKAASADKDFELHWYRNRRYKNQLKRLTDRLYHYLYNE